MHQNRPSPLGNEKGVVLVLSLLVLLTLSVLSAGLMFSAVTETKISANGLWDIQALFIAEAGIEEAIQRLSLPYPTQVTVNGKTFNASIKDTGSLDSDWATRVFLCVHPPPAGSGNVEHTATVQPSGSWLKYSHPTHADLALTIQHKLNEDGTIAMRDDYPINLITVSGRQGLVRRELLAEVYAIPNWPVSNAVLCDGPAVISGMPIIDGSNAHVHTNSNLEITGDPHILGDVTASGSITISGNPTIDGNIEQGVPEQWIPDVKAAHYRYMADYILKSDGSICDAEGNPVSDDLGWNFAGGNWRVQDPQPVSAVYYVQANVVVTAEPGTPESPWETTIISEGSISFSGNPSMRARYGSILLVAEGDLDQDGAIDAEPVIEISGNPAQETENYDGAILSAGDIKTKGDPAIQGCVVAEGGIEIGGEANITFSGTVSEFPYIKYELCAWRER